MINAVLFDAGNTLLTPSPSVAKVFEEIAGKCGYEFLSGDVEECLPVMESYYEERYNEDDSFWCSADRASMIWVEMYKTLCFELGIAEDAEKVARAVYEAYTHAERWKVFPDVLGTLNALQSSGIRMGVVSNWDQYLRSIFDGLELSRYFEVLLSSADVGIRKPDPEIFEMAADRIGIPAANIAFVGDHLYADAMGAQQRDMTPILLTRQPAFVPSSILHVDTLTEIPALIATL